METADLTHHISRRFNEDLEKVRNQVLQMGGFVEQQLHKAITALVEGDSQLGESVATDDYKVNGMEVSIDEECSRILALRAPAAGDLRVIVAIIKTITDLERIGDEGEKIGYIASRWRPWSGRPTSIGRSSTSVARSRRWCTMRSMPSRAWTPQAALRDRPGGPDGGRGVRGHPAPVHHLHDGGSAHHPAGARRSCGSCARWSGSAITPRTSAST